jgi:hypothetical protein
MTLRVFPIAMTASPQTLNQDRGGRRARMVAGQPQAAFQQDLVDRPTMQPLGDDVGRHAGDDDRQDQLVAAGQLDHQHDTDQRRADGGREQPAHGGDGEGSADQRRHGQRSYRQQHLDQRAGDQADDGGKGQHGREDAGRDAHRIARHGADEAHDRDQQQGQDRQVGQDHARDQGFTAADRERQDGCQCPHRRADDDGEGEGRASERRRPPIERRDQAAIEQHAQHAKPRAQHHEGRQQQQRHGLGVDPERRRGAAHQLHAEGARR